MFVGLIINYLKKNKKGKRAKGRRGKVACSDISKLAKILKIFGPVHTQKRLGITSQHQAIRSFHGELFINFLKCLDFYT